MYKPLRLGFEPEGFYEIGDASANALYHSVCL